MTRLRDAHTHLQDAEFHLRNARRALIAAADVSPDALLGERAGRSAQLIDQALTAATTPEEPLCSTCGGSGEVVLNDHPDRDPQFERSVPCSCGGL